MRRTGGMAKKTGWHRRDARRLLGDFSDLPVVPSAWEELLRGRDLTERQALLAVRSGVGIGIELQSWVRRNCRQRFVPERVLKAMGISAAEVVAERVVSEETREKLSAISRRGWALRG